MATLDQIEKANKQEIDKLNDLLADAKQQIEDLKTEHKKAVDKLDDAIKRLEIIHSVSDPESEVDTI